MSEEETKDWKAEFTDAVIDYLSDKFQVSAPTIKRYLSGEAEPHEMAKARILKELKSACHDQRR